jgi:hypothetical protein
VIAARGLAPERVGACITGLGAGAHCVGAYIPGIVVGGVADCCGVAGAGAGDDAGGGGGAAKRGGGAGTAAGALLATGTATEPAVTVAASAAPQCVH